MCLTVGPGKGAAKRVANECVLLVLRITRMSPVRTKCDRRGSVSRTHQHESTPQWMTLWTPTRSGSNWSEIEVDVVPHVFNNRVPKNMTERVEIMAVFQIAARRKALGSISVCRRLMGPACDAAAMPPYTPVGPDRGRGLQQSAAEQVDIKVHVGPTSRFSS